MTEIYDKNGNARDMAWLQGKYGNVQILDAGSGTKFKLMRVDETEGPAVIKVRVLNEYGAPHAEQPVANNWPDNSLPDLSNGGLKTLWKPRALYQRTASDGTTGFGIGTGSYIRDLTDGGPHTIWVLSPSLPSDGLSGVGMLGGTDHMGPLFLTFQIADQAGGGGSGGGGSASSPTRLDRMITLATPMMGGNRSAATIAERARDVLTALEAAAVNQ